jgi:streptomycin 6-kinase
MVARLTRRWGLRIEGAAPGNTGRTLRCRDRRGRLVVLKLTPERDIAATEAAALRAWAGCPSVVDLLDADLDSGAILLAGIVPGTPLAESGWQPAEVDALLAQLGDVAVPAGLPTLIERLNGMFDLGERRGSVPPGSRAAALALAAEGPRRLLHGDLHPGNVLRAAHGIIAIDPRPCLGDPAFDAVDWAMRADSGLDRAIAGLPSVDPDRLRRWSEALAVFF